MHAPPVATGTPRGRRKRGRPTKPSVTCASPFHPSTPPRVGSASTGTPAPTTTMTTGSLTTAPATTTTTTIPSTPGRMGTDIGADTDLAGMMGQEDVNDSDPDPSPSLAASKRLRRNGGGYSARKRTPNKSVANAMDIDSPAFLHLNHPSYLRGYASSPLRSTTTEHQHPPSLFSWALVPNHGPQSTTRDASHKRAKDDVSDNDSDSSNIDKFDAMKLCTPIRHHPIASVISAPSPFFKPDLYNPSPDKIIIIEDGSITPPSVTNIPPGLQTPRRNNNTPRRFKSPAFLGAPIIAGTPGTARRLFVSNNKANTVTTKLHSPTSPHVVTSRHVASSPLAPKSASVSVKNSPGTSPSGPIHSTLTSTDTTTDTKPLNRPALMSLNLLPSCKPTDDKEVTGSTTTTNPTTMKAVMNDIPTSSTSSCLPHAYPTTTTHVNSPSVSTRLRHNENNCVVHMDTRSSSSVEAANPSVVHHVTRSMARLSHERGKGRVKDNHHQVTANSNLPVLDTPPPTSTHTHYDLRATPSRLRATRR